MSIHPLHPSRWPLAIWFVVVVGGALLRIDYTLGSFSFAPAFALLAGTWLGARRATLVQGLALVALIPASIVAPASTNPGEWGFRIGLVAAAALAGTIARPDDSGAHPPAAVRRTVLGAAGATVALILFIVPRVTIGRLGVYFALTLLLATAIAVFYAYRMVPEPQRVVGYFFCLLPYYLAGFVGNLILVAGWPAAAAAAGIPDGWRAILFHSYFSHLPGELIALVVIAYLVCAVDRPEGIEGPLAIGASR